MTEKKQGFRKTYEICASCRKHGWYSRRIITKNAAPLYSWRCKYCGQHGTAGEPPKPASVPMPDFTQNCATRFGGDLYNIPKPHIRLWPNPNSKRPVTVNIRRYSGYPHYWACVEEAFNPAWNPTLYDSKWGEDLAGMIIGWQEFRDDIEGKGRHFEKECNSESEAKKFIQSTLLREFPPETHAVKGDREYLATKIVHIYKHEGA